jgi:hypothetical protein
MVHTQLFRPREHCVKDDSEELPQKSQHPRGRTRAASRLSIRKGVENRAFYVDLKVPPPKGRPQSATNPPDKGLHVLARIFADRIETWPTGTNPRDLFDIVYGIGEDRPYPRVIYRLPKPFPGPLPSNPSSAVSHIERVFDSRLFNSCAQGLGFKPFLNGVLRALQVDKVVDTIEINFKGELLRRENVVCVSEATLDNFRKAFNSADAFWNRQKEGSRSSFIYEKIVEKLIPNLSNPDGLGSHYFTRFEGAERDFLAKLQGYISDLPLGLPEDFKAMRESMDRGELYRMIHHYQTMLAQNLSASDWHSFLSHNLDLVIKCFQHPECGVLDPPLGVQPKCSVGSPIICGHEALVLTVRSPEATLMTRGSPSSVVSPDLQGLGEPPDRWVPHPDLASAIEEGRKLRPDIKGQIQKPRFVVVAGLMPTDVEEAVAYMSYREAARKYKEVHLVDFGTLLNGFSFLASVKGP